MTGSITVCTTHVPIVVGSYARLIRKGDGDSDSNRYEWTVVVHIDGRIHGDLGNYVDKIDFFLHKSFAIVCKPCYSYQPSVQPNRRCTKAPFFISDEGWGEFPVGLELTLRHGGNLKLTHYLKLDSPDPIIVNQTFETLILPVCLSFFAAHIISAWLSPSRPTARNCRNENSFGR